MSTDLPDSFDPQQPDLPTLAVDPAPDAGEDGPALRSDPDDWSVEGTSEEDPS